MIDDDFNYAGFYDTKSHLQNPNYHGNGVTLLPSTATNPTPKSLVDTKDSSGNAAPQPPNGPDTTNDPKFKRIKPELATWRDYLGAMAGGFGNGWNFGVATVDYKIGQAYAWITGDNVAPWLQEWYDQASQDSGLGEGTKYATQCFANIGLGAFSSAVALNVLAVAGVSSVGYATSVRGAYYILWEEACIAGGTGTLFPAAYIRRLMTLNCFTAGTQIVVGMEYDDDGNFVQYVTMNIENVKVGDLVYSYNTLTGEVGLREVTDTFVRSSDHINYLTIVDEHGHEQTIETTDGHPFWVVTTNPDMSRVARDYVFENDQWLFHEDVTPTGFGYWVEAKDLCVGDVFLGTNGELSTLTNIVRVEQSDGIAVFNFTVEGNHNYFILAKDYKYGQSCILVHNATGYRAVSQAELDDILRSGKFRPGHNTMPGKWFATTEEGAEDFLRSLQRYQDAPPTRIVKADVADDIIGHWSKMQDGIADSFYVYPEMLPLIKPLF